MAEGVVRMPGPGREVERLISKGYCAKCIKKHHQLHGASADEVDIIARRTPGALEGVCVECGAERRHSVPAIRTS